MCIRDSEYTHGISNRLTGGPSSVGCLSETMDHENQEANGMGEGWSDFVALTLTARPGDTGPKRRGIGTFAQREETNGKGIRDYPYSTDMTVNPLTYNSIQTQPGEHGVERRDVDAHASAQGIRDLPKHLHHRLGNLGASTI